MTKHRTDDGDTPASGRYWRLRTVLAIAQFAAWALIEGIRHRF